MQTLFNEFKELIDSTPSPHHVKSYLQKRLLKAGFSPLKENKVWALEPGKKYIVSRGCTTTCIVMAKKSVKQTKILVSHLDTPALKLRPHPIFFDEGFAFFRTEVYGGPHLYSWMNRKLQLAGAYWEDSTLEPVLGTVTQNFFLPTCPIHLDKEANRKPSPIQKHHQLSVFIGEVKEGMDEKTYLNNFFSKHFSINVPLSFDFYFTVNSSPYFIDDLEQKIAAPRIDNSASVFASLKAMEQAQPQEHTILISTFFHHEEVGSGSYQGAASNLLPSLLSRLLSALNIDTENQAAITYSSSILSLDNAHAFWPLDKSKYDKPNSPILGHGPALKATSSMRYATSPAMVALIKKIAKKANIPLQFSVPHSDHPAGSTLGPLVAKTSGIPTIDIGLGQCSMHGAEEMMDLRDLDSLIKLLQSYLASNEKSA
ncbi:hypothetical protein COB21_04255 [Candidatus Aerophobetes bacterium]|uniref:M18 family aminopeptidase n=1 Tax=Aerophobetes bacterium TaxID=2030807 RepID=A0A2A4X369_UNCAE|nr:MAG: hypothetical protein COB21_04255 [Candidatus Aerophobetes bacterium]